jgi:L-fuculose-phosphate aldolase
MPSAPLPSLKAELVRVSHALHANGWVANHDGNLSVRLHGGRLLITPTAVSKARVDAGMLLIVDAAGKVLEGQRKPFSELELHLAIYRARPDAEVVLHAHPPYATAFGLTGVELTTTVMPEVVVSLGDRVPLVPRALPRDAAQVKAVEEAAKVADALLVAGNGAFTLGADLEQALLRMELLEHCAKILTAAKALGPVSPLPAADVAKLLEARKKAGLGPPAK